MNMIGPVCSPGCEKANHCWRCRRSRWYWTQ